MNYYSRAIDIFESIRETPSLQKKYLLEIVKNNPSAIIRASETIAARQEKASKNDLLIDRIKYLYKISKKQAAKEYSIATGLEFADAKRDVECICDHRQVDTETGEDR